MHARRRQVAAANPSTADTTPARTAGGPLRPVWIPAAGAGPRRWFRAVGRLHNPRFPRAPRGSVDSRRVDVWQERHFRWAGLPVLLAPRAGGLDHRHDAGADGLGQPVPRFDDGRQVGRFLNQKRQAERQDRISVVASRGKFAGCIARAADCKSATVGSTPTSASCRFPPGMFFPLGSQADAAIPSSHLPLALDDSPPRPGKVWNSSETRWTTCSSRFWAGTPKKARRPRFRPNCKKAFPTFRSSPS